MKKKGKEEVQAARGEGAAGMGKVREGQDRQLPSNRLGDGEL